MQTHRNNTRPSKSPCFLHELHHLPFLLLFSWRRWIGSLQDIKTTALNLSWCYLTWLKYWNKNQRNTVLTFGSWNQWKNLQVSVLLPWKVFEWWFKFSIWRCVTWFPTTRYFQGISSVRVTPKHDVLGFCVCVCCRNREIFCPRIPDPSTIFKEMMMTGNRDSKVYTWKKKKSSQMLFLSS